MSMLSPNQGRKAELTKVAGYILRWFTIYRQSPIQVVTGSDVEQLH